MKNVEKVIKKWFTALHAAENLLYFNGDSGDVVFICNETGILNNISLDNIIILVFIIILIKKILIAIFLSDLWLGILNLKNKNKEL